MERICKDFARITSDNVDPGGVRLTVNLKRICKDFARITSDNVDPVGGGSIDGQLGKDWGGQSMVKDFARIASDNVDPVGGGG